MKLWLSAGAEHPGDASSGTYGNRPLPPRFAGETGRPSSPSTTGGSDALLSGERGALDHHVAEQALDLRRIDEARAQVLGGLRAAGDAEHERLLGGLAAVAGGDEGGQERVARAN